MPGPDDPVWLRALVERSLVLPEPALRAHWVRLIEWLPAELRYELAGILMDVEVGCAD